MMAGCPRRAPKAWGPHPRKPILCLSCWRPLCMHVALVNGLCRHCLSCFYSAVRSTILLCLPLMVSSTLSVGDLAVVTPCSLQPVVVPVPGVACAGGASQGVTGVVVVGADTQVGDDTGSLLQNLMMRGTDAGVPRMQKTGPPCHRGRHWRGYHVWRWRTPWCYPLLARMTKALFRRLPSLRVSLR
jgi:hypothetical protein